MRKRFRDNLVLQIMKQNETKLSKKISDPYFCILCKYSTSKYADYNKHLQTKKHIKHESVTEVKQIVTKNLSCNCGETFNNRTTLWRHKKKCKDDEMMYNGINIKDKDALVLHLLQENSKLTNKLIEMTPQTSITNNTNNSNSHNTNNNFNLNFFLNETCKNAMNISDFVSSIKMDLDDLEHVGRTSYIEGITNIVVKNLNNLEQQLRPLHCSDAKRETLYIKDNNEWTKETDNKPILTNTIKTIANQNIKQINNWVQEHPDCIKSNSRKNDLYLKIVSNSMNGLTKEEGEKNINKIISNVAKKVTINK